MRLGVLIYENITDVSNII